MSNAITISAQQGFYEKAVLNMLSKMNLGRLNLTLPSGATLELGNGEGGVIANAEIKDPEFFKRCVLYGDIGFGEAYVDGDWDTDNITNVIKWFLLNVENAPTVSGSSAQS